MASIRKRGENSYQITVCAGYDSKGKKLTKTKTVQRPDGFTDKKWDRELKLVAAEFERLVETGKYIESNITVKEFFEIWFKDHVAKRLSPKTNHEYRRYYDDRIIPALGHLKLDRLRPVHLIEFYNNLEEKGMIHNIKYVAKPELISIITGSNKRKGYAAFAHIVDVSDRTIASLCKGGKTTNIIAEKISTKLNKRVGELFNPVNNKDTLSTNTILHYHSALSSMLTCAVQWQVISSNPAERVKPPKAEKTEPHHYDEDEVSYMLHLADKEDVRTKTIVYLVIFGGMRLGELSGLEWKDLNLKNNLMKIQRASQYINDKSKPKENRINPKSPKNESSKRIIAIPSILTKTLKQYKVWQNEQKLKLGDLWQRKEKDLYGEQYDNDRLFTKWNGSPIFPDTPSKWFKKFREKNNLPPLTFHQLRHTNASLLIAQGIDTTTVGKRLGHSTPATTMKIYAHALKRPDREAANKLEELFNNKQKNKKQA